MLSGSRRTSITSVSTHSVRWVPSRQIQIVDRRGGAISAMTFAPPLLMSTSVAADLRYAGPSHQPSQASFSTGA